MIIHTVKVDHTPQHTGTQPLTHRTHVQVRLLQQPETQTPHHVEYVVGSGYAVRDYCQGLDQHLRERCVIVRDWTSI